MTPKELKDLDETKEDKISIIDEYDLVPEKVTNALLQLLKDRNVR